jgi:hypothetical protein
MANKNANIDIFFDADYAAEPDGLGQALRESALIEDFLDDED